TSATLRRNAGAGGSRDAQSGGARGDAGPRGTVVCGSKSGRRSLRSAAPLSLVEPLLQPDQEMMRQEHQGHMVVPARPEPQLVVVQAQFTLALGKAGLDGPAHPADPHEGLQRRVRRGVTQVVLELRHVRWT